ncbi:MAG: uracil-DNA glycosylase family protein [Bradymonadaceae bacterium]
MSDKAQLYRLTHDLRRYLEWQRASGAVGAVPASLEARAAWDAKESERRNARLQRLRASFAEPSPPPAVYPEPVEPTLVAPSGPSPVQAPPLATPPVDVQTSPGQAAPTPGANAPWKTIGSRPRPTFIAEATKKKPAQDSAVDPEAMTAREKLEFLRSYMGDCERCPLHEGRTNIVFGTGNAKARLMFIGEGPGFHEDKQGLPFVGESGQLLDRMIGAMGLSREQVYITNVVKCRPPKNRDPLVDEIRECSPFLMKQIGVVQPEVIITLGRFATQTLLQTAENMGALRGTWQTFKEIPVMPTYHPAYLLRQEDDPKPRRAVWSDLKLVMERLGLTNT